MSAQTVEEFLAHYGKKGMQWGTRKARKEVNFVGAKARGIIKESGNATTNKGRKVAADRYEKEVLSVIKTKEFKAKYREANTMTKGQMAAHVLVYGPLAPLTIKAMNSQLAANRAVGPNREVAMAQQVLKELRQPL